MKWPWVPRGDLVVAQLQARIWEDNWNVERKRVAQLENLLYGTKEPVAPEQPAPLPPKKEDEARTLIHEMCGKDLKKRALMLKQLKADRAANVSEDKIIEAIQQGVQPEGVP